MRIRITDLKTYGLTVFESSRFVITEGQSSCRTRFSLPFHFFTRPRARAPWAHPWIRRSISLFRLPSLVYINPPSFTSQYAEMYSHVFVACTDLGLALQGFWNGAASLLQKELASDQLCVYIQYTRVCSTNRRNTADLLLNQYLNAVIYKKQKFVE